MPYTSEFSFKSLAFDMIGTFNEPFYVEKKSMFTGNNLYNSQSQGGQGSQANVYSDREGLLSAEDENDDNLTVLVQFVKLDAPWNQHRIIQLCPEMEKGYLKVTPSAILDGKMPNEPMPY